MSERGAATLGPADYAAACLRAVVRDEPSPAAPPHPLFGGRAACFVSLKKDGELRGCIGTLEPLQQTLALEIAHNAASSALHDHRFEVVSASELSAITCSVDVLSASRPCRRDELDPARYGVIVTRGGRRGVLLPALEGVDGVEQQLSIALRKAGIPSGRSFELYRFTVTRFREGDGPEGGERVGDAASA